MATIIVCATEMMRLQHFVKVSQLNYGSMFDRNVFNVVFLHRQVSVAILWGMPIYSRVHYSRV